jgi:tripartite-type tricarboxylate transporter receptor subunit TctC
MKTGKEPMLQRREFLGIAGGMLAAPAFAQSRYPSRPIRVIVPFAPGGLIDLVARIITEPMPRLLGQPVVVENQPGAGSTIGARAVARAAPDGHTLLLNGAAHSVIPALFADAGVDPIADFIPISTLGDQGFVLAVHPSLPVRDVPQFRAWLHEKRGEATFATTGIGAASHLSGELLKKLAGVEFTIVQYRGTPAAMTDFMAGRVDFVIDSQTLVAPLVCDGKARGLAVTTARRSRLLPELPTLQEAGVADYAASSWQALYAPAGTPAEIINALSSAVVQAFNDASVQKRFADAGIEPMPNDPAASARFIRAEIEKWVPILRATGAKAG